MAVNITLYADRFAFADRVDGLEQWFPPKDLRRLDAYTKLALHAAARTLDGIPDRDGIGLIVASGYGPVRRTCEFMDSILDDGPLCASPLAFSGSVHNVVETAVTMLLSLRGPCLSVSQLGTSFESALATAQSWLISGRCRRVLLGAVDEAHPVYLRRHPDEPHPAGAAFFLLSLDGSVPLPPPGEPADARHPARQAFELAWRLAPLLGRGEIRQIARDFIKTELARMKRDPLAAFSGAEPEALLHEAAEDDRRRILAELLRFFSVQDAAPRTLEEALALAGAAYARERRFNFRTSGSTGVPVDCIQDEGTIREELDGLRFLFGKIRRIVCVVPVHHSYGFIFGLQMPKLLGIPARHEAALPFLPWHEMLEPGDLLVAFPMFLQQWVDGGAPVPPGVTVLTATAPCPDALHEALRRGGVRRCVEIYGSSEGGAIAWREAAGAPFELLPHWEGEAVRGRLESIRRKQTALAFELPDLAAMEGERRFRLQGRRDKAVQIAGINVYPAKVERYLSRHPSVAACAVRQEGEHLKAFVVLRDPSGEAAARTELHAYLQALSAHEIPKKIRFGPAIPLTPHGKKTDW